MKTPARVAAVADEVRRRHPAIPQNPLPLALTAGQDEEPTDEPEKII